MQQHVGRHVVAEQRLGERLGVDVDVARRARVASLDRLERCASSAGKRTPVSVTIAAVGTACVETTATVRSGSATQQVLSGWPRRAGRSRAARRPRRPTPCSSPRSASREIRTSETTGPPFWPGPVWSRPSVPAVEHARPSAGSAMTVTTPVPPMPGIRTQEVVARHAQRRLGQRRGRLRERRGPLPPCALGGMTSGTTGSRPSGRRSPCCRRPGGSASCGRTRSRPAGPTGSWTSRRSRRSPRRRAR